MAVSQADKFEERKAAIIDVASDLLNHHGAQGLTLAEVAIKLGLDASSISYYFKRKDDLIAACLDRTARWIEAEAAKAGLRGNHLDRMRAFFDANFELLALQRRGEQAPLAVLSDRPSLSENARQPIDARLIRAHRLIAAFYPPAENTSQRIRVDVATSALLSAVFWMPAWDGGFRLADFPRASDRLYGLYAHGLVNAPQPLDEVDVLETEGDDAPIARFLQAATVQINKLGYKGARVDLIAAEIGVSTGSFYHHLKTKDELVVASFERSFNIIARAYEIAESEELCPGDALLMIARLLGRHQLSSNVPLLRIGAYQALPEGLRQNMLNRTAQLANHLAGLIADGMGDGSVRPTDPVIASNTLLAILHGLSELKVRIPAEHRGMALDHFIDMLRTGFHQEA